MNAKDTNRAVGGESGTDTRPASSRPSLHAEKARHRGGDSQTRLRCPEGIAATWRWRRIRWRESVRRSSIEQAGRFAAQTAGGADSLDGFVEGDELWEKEVLRLRIRGPRSAPRRDLCPSMSSAALFRDVQWRWGRESRHLLSCQRDAHLLPGLRFPPEIHPQPDHHAGRLPLRFPLRLSQRRGEEQPDD